MTKQNLILVNVARVQSCKVRHRTGYTFFLCIFYQISRICKKELARLSLMTILPNIDRISLLIRIQHTPSDPRFAKNSKCKNYFLAACKCINPPVDLHDVNLRTSFGGLIGVDDSELERIFSQNLC